ncbi:MAG: hypothetical protein EBV71_01825 [Chitinophagia bacterium]|nr:hypothetical protein [Chitinophagia bacterium]
MKQQHIVAAALVLFIGLSIESQAQSPTVQREVRLISPSTGGNYVGMKASTSTATYTLSMPATLPTANQVLTVSGITGATGWSLTGNAGTTSSTFLGTTDAQPLVMKTNGSTRMILAQDGGVTINSLSGAAASASATATNEGAVVSDANGLVSKASYASIVSAGLTNSTTGLTVGGPFTVSGLLTANAGLTVAGGALNLTGTNPLLLNGAAGNAGEILQSNGAGAAPTWSSAFIKGRGLVSVSANESIVVSATNVDADDAINVTLEGSSNDMAIPSYYVVRTANTGFTIYFSAPFTGSCNWSVVNQ